MTKNCLPRFLYFVCLVISISNCISQEKIIIKNLKGFDVSTDSIKVFIELRIDTHNIPGLSIAVINNAKVVYHQTFGFANLEKRIPVTDKTIFEGTSLSKSVFAFFVMKFVEEGKLDLDNFYTNIYHIQI